MSANNPKKSESSINPCKSVIQTKEGYKMTEYGKIPFDWLYCHFEDVLTGFSSGMTPYRGIPEYYEGDIPWVTSGELEYNVITDTIEKITPDAVNNTNLKILPKGTFLMAITGLEAAGTRGSCAITGIECTTNQSCMALFPIKGRIITEYLYHFYVRYGDQLAFRYCQGTKQQSYTGRLVKILPIVIPPTLTEQRAIATALSDVDALISSLDKLIEKKKTIKQGAMQELLTPPDKGGKRLEGFSGEWIDVSLGKYVRYQVGFPFGSSFFNQKKQGIRLVKNRDLKSDDSIYYYSGEYSSEYLVNDGDVLIGMDGDFMPCYWNKGTALLNQRVGRLIPLQKVSLTFLYYYIMKPLIEIEAKTSSTTVKHLSHSDIEKMVLKMPHLEEQNQIAQILMDLDQSVENLEVKRNKYKKIKQGMMQELLTGKTRLV